MTPWKPDDEQTRLLNNLCQSRRGLIEQRTSLAQQLLNLLKCYFPALLLLANCKLYNCPLLLKLLVKWPDPRELKRQHPATLKAIFEEFGYKKAEQRDPLIKSIKDASLYTKDLPVLECNALLARVTAQQLMALGEASNSLSKGSHR